MSGCCNFPVAILGGSSPPGSGGIAAIATLSSPAISPNVGVYGTLLSKAITILGASSAILVYASFMARKMDAIGTGRYRLLLDGIVTGNGMWGSQGSDANVSCIIPALYPVAAGAHTVELQWLCDVETFKIDVGNFYHVAPSPNALLFLREVRA